MSSCKEDTEKHITNVKLYAFRIINALIDQVELHDQSKLESPEVEIFEKFTEKLKDSTYGSEEYNTFLKEMKPALDHHYEVNRHHPEHFPETGISGMTLVDLIELIADWKSATLRHSNGDLNKSFEVNEKRFKIEPQLLQILKNTAERYF